MKDHENSLRKMYLNSVHKANKLEQQTIDLELQILKLTRKRELIMERLEIARDHVEKFTDCYSPKILGIEEE